MKIYLSSKATILQLNIFININRDVIKMKLYGKSQKFQNSKHVQLEGSNGGTQLKSLFDKNNLVVYCLENSSA